MRLDVSDIAQVHAAFLVYMDLTEGEDDYQTFFVSWLLLKLG